MNIKKILSALIFITATFPSLALDLEERTFFGLTRLASTHPQLTGQGFSIGVSDTEFDLTHPGLGWTGGNEYYDWFYNRQYIPNLNRVNPRIFMAGHRMQTSMNNIMRHGVNIYGFELPITYNNTLMTNWWSYHGTLVAGAAASGQPGPEGHSLGAAHQARLVFAGDTENFEYLLSMVPDGNPSKTVSMNRSFTGSSYVTSEVRNNSGVIGVNAAGNSFNLLNQNRTEVYGTSPHVASIRWLDQVGYDLIASGLALENTTNAYAEQYGSMRNQESIFTDYSVRTLYAGGHFDGYASGTSLASPLLAGGVVLVQQAFATAHPGKWLRIDQMNRILKKSGKFVDDIFTGLRIPVANFADAVALAETYAGDPSFEPNFNAMFNPEPRIENTMVANTNRYLNPLYFRTVSTYGVNHYQEYTTPIVEGGFMKVRGNGGGGHVNVALRNGWGDLAKINLTEPGKKFSTSFSYDTSAGAASGSRTEFFVGIKEMVGSAQFMDSDRMSDNIDRGRLAFKVSYTKHDTQARVELLQCSEAPVTSTPYSNDPVWQRPSYYIIPQWDATPLAVAYATNLHNGVLPRIEAGFTSERATFKINNQTIIDVAHTAPQIALTRATPYLHFYNSAPDSQQRLSGFFAVTTSGGTPIVTLENTRQRAVEGVNGVTAHGVLKVSRTTSATTPLTVHYSVNGTAANGSDYQMLPGSITIPANVASAELIIQPLDDATVESPEHVAVSLTPNGAYIISPLSETGRVNIVDLSDADSDGIKSRDEDVNRNGNFSDDDANANMLPNYLDNADQVPTNNVAPVAQAGSDFSVYGTQTGSLNGSTSYDPDGHITYYSWSILPGNNGPVIITGANTATPQIHWNFPTATNRSIHVELTVTDNHGATASDTVTVTQLASPIYNKNYPQVYFRGTPNGWGTTIMELVGHNTWEVEVYAQAGAQNFKFDVHGDWSLNFGDSNNDGYADQGAGNIGFNQGASFYRIRFNDQTRAYSVTKVIVNQPPVANAGGNKTTYQMNAVTLDGSGSHDPDGSIASYRWFIIEGADGPVNITGTNTSTATVQWHAPAISSRFVRVQLMVTDNAGSSASDIVTVTQTTNLVFSKTHPQVYFRGTANGWGTTSMTLISNYTWFTEATFSSGSNDRFKFDVNGDWSLNFGDNNNDKIADQSGGDIAITQGTGTYRIWFNDQTRRYALNKIAVNQKPVANAGPAQTVGLDGATVNLDGSGSYDPDGSIIEYSWYQSSGPTAIITYAHPGNPGATVVILSRTNNATYTFSLRVTDNEGAMSTGTVTVTQKAAGYNKVQPQVYFRGSPNNWGTTLMTLVSNYIWETEATFSGASNERFKFDVFGDWSLNFGDNNNDGTAEQSGNDIGVTQGAGTYRIRFNDQTRAYTVAKIGGSFIKDYTSMSVAGTFNNWNPAAQNMTLIGDNTWSGTFVLSGQVQFKFAGNGSWGANWGENDQPGTSIPLNGYAEGNGGNISLNNLASATYRITMHERTRAYSVVLVTGSEAGAGRLLLGWEALYNLDLFGAEISSDDPDLDSLTNLDEYHLGTNPYRADSDHDGMNDREETIAATDPMDTTSFLQVAAVMVDGQIILQWSQEPNRLYRLEGCHQLGDDGNWVPVTDWITAGPGSSIESTIAPGAHIYYRVRVSEPNGIGVSLE